MSRTPNIGPEERERVAQIKRLERLLRELERVPAHRRDDECADVRERDVRQFLAELGAPGYALPERVKPTVEIVDLDAWLDEIGAER